MGRYILVAETGADIPSGIAEKYGIQIVPMHVSFGDDTKDDGTFPVDEVFSYYEETGILAKTSGCTPNDFEQVFARIQREHPGKHIIHLAYSAATTCSFQSALIAAEGREGIISIDTKFASAGQALVVIAMARFLEENPDCPLEEVIEKAESVIWHCRMGFFLGDLVYLKAGGRVSNAQYLGAKLLSLHPLIELRDGKLQATKKYRGSMEKVVPGFFREFVEGQRLRREILELVYSRGLNGEIREQAEEMARQAGFQEILWIQTGCVVSIHSGPGGFGICGFSEEPA